MGGWVSVVTALLYDDATMIVLATVVFQRLNLSSAKTLTPLIQLNKSLTIHSKNLSTSNTSTANNHHKQRALPLPTQHTLVSNRMEGPPQTPP